MHHHDIIDSTHVSYVILYKDLWFGSATLNNLIIFRGIFLSAFNNCEHLVYNLQMYLAQLCMRITLILQRHFWASWKVSTIWIVHMLFQHLFVLIRFTPCAQPHLDGHILLRIQHITLHINFKCAACQWCQTHHHCVHFRRVAQCLVEANNVDSDDMLPSQHKSSLVMAKASRSSISHVLSKQTNINRFRTVTTAAMLVDWPKAWT